MEKIQRVEKGKKVEEREGEKRARFSLALSPSAPGPSYVAPAQEEENDHQILIEFTKSKSLDLYPLISDFIGKF